MGCRILWWAIKRGLSCTCTKRKRLPRANSKRRSLKREICRPILILENREYRQMANENSQVPVLLGSARFAFAILKRAGVLLPVGGRLSVATGRQSENPTV